MWPRGVLSPLSSSLSSVQRSYCLCTGLPAVTLSRTPTAGADARLRTSEENARRLFFLENQTLLVVLPGSHALINCWRCWQSIRQIQVRRRSFVLTVKLVSVLVSSISILFTSRHFSLFLLYIYALTTGYNIQSTVTSIFSLSVSTIILNLTISEFISCTIILKKNIVTLFIWL
jgi:hypothetical protein